MRVVLAVLLLLCPALANAQAGSPAAPPRGDVAGLVGWLNAPFDLPADIFRDHDWTPHATGVAVAGLYWNDHWKTEVSVARSTSAWTYSSEVVQHGTELVHRGAEHRVRYTRFTAAQFYQFGRNDWVHPSVGGGVLVERRTGESEYYPAVYQRDPRTPAVIDLGGPRDLPATTEIQPFVAAGVKAYLTPRAFFRSDVQLAFGRNVESVVVHAGFGIDF